MTPQQRLEQARSADALENPWGLYLSPNEAPDGLAWFKTEDELLAFVAEGLWQALSGVEPDAETALELKDLAESSAGLRLNALDDLNLCLEPVAQIHWWGSLEQLYQGEDSFAKDLRETWRQEAGRGPQDFSVLAPGDARAFADFLKNVFAAE